MGFLIDGVWHDQGYDTHRHGGRFMRAASQFRNWVTADGTPGPTGTGGFAAQPERYHLYVSYACPWAHRTLIFRALKGLEHVIAVSVVEPDMLEKGWHFDPQGWGTGDAVHGCEFLYQVYLRASPSHRGRVTVPVLWDKQQELIVNNESSEIIRMFNGAFSAYARNSVDYYPMSLRAKIDEINELVYRNVNNGVYRCGFATTQLAYEEAFDDLFNTLDRLESLLGKYRYLVGKRLTEADWRLFTTLVRFDVVYHGHFKCNRQRIDDYPNLSNYLRELYQVPGVADTTHFDHIKRHYYHSHRTINPTGIVPKGPAIDFYRPHNRDQLT